jgi:hypothetical protein
MVTTTAVRIGAFSTGRMTIRSMSIPPANDTASVITNAAQNGSSALTSVQAI